MNKASIIILFVCMLFSCTSELPDGDALVKEMYEQKVRDYLEQTHKTCVDKALDEAQLDVDSIVHGMLNIGLVDTVDFPSRPYKPQTPDHIIGSVERFDIKEDVDTSGVDDR